MCCQWYRARKDNLKINNKNSAGYDGVTITVIKHVKSSSEKYRYTSQHDEHNGFPYIVWSCHFYEVHLITLVHLVAVYIIFIILLLLITKTNLHTLCVNNYNKKNVLILKGRKAISHNGLGVSNNAIGGSDLTITTD